MVSSDALHMARALAHAERGRGRTSPNPMVGAVVVTPDGVVAGTGYHERAGGPHAEVHALSAAGSLAKGATLYCTLEPCCHTGRTGPCTELIVESGIARVVAAVEDPNPLVRGGGFRRLEAHGIAVEVGVGRVPATRLNEPYFTLFQRGRPFVTMKIATSLDGHTAAAAGERTPITCDASAHRQHQFRAEVDAIAIGSETALVDDPLLTARLVYRARPLIRVVFDRRLRTPPGARLLSTLAEGSVVILTTREAIAKSPERADALASAGATIAAVEGGDIRQGMARLGEMGIGSVLLEGGTTIHRAAWNAGLVDRVQLYLSPRPLTGGTPWLEDGSLSIASLYDLKVEPCGDDVFLEGYVHRID